MKYAEVLDIVEEEPVFDTGLLLAGNIQASDLYQQLTYWKNSGRVIQLRRGLYALAPPYQKVRPHPFLIANRMVSGSYVSCQSALAYAGLIPEWVPMVTSVSTGRPGIWKTPLGEYWCRHIRKGLFFGYHHVEVMPGQRAFVAEPEKALLDLIHLQPDGDSEEYLNSLRLQNLEAFNFDTFADLAERGGRPKLTRAISVVEKIVAVLGQEYRDEGLVLSSDRGE